MRQLIIMILLMVSPACFSQVGDSLFLYRRGSIYSVMISHRDLMFENEIEAAFSKMPVPDKYNDHGLGKKIFYTSEKKLKTKNLDEHTGFIVNRSSDKSNMNEYDKQTGCQMVPSEESDGCMRYGTGEGERL